MKMRSIINIVENVVIAKSFGPFELSVDKNGIIEIK